MPPYPRVPEELLEGPFIGTLAVCARLLTSNQLRSRSWRRLLRDVYLHRDYSLDLDTRMRAVKLILPPGAVVSGRTAAWLHGVDILRQGEPLEVTLLRDTSMKSRPDLLIRRAALAAHAFTVLAGVPVTTPLRTAFDLGRRVRPGHRPSLTEAVVAVDALAHAELITLEGLLTYAALPDHFRWRGVRLVKDVVHHAEPRSESPMESRLRMVLVLGGLPRPEAQVAVSDRAGRKLRIDLGYPSALLGVEYDGEHHRDRWHDDLARQNLLHEQGWTLLRYSKTDIYRRPRLIISQVTQQLR